MGYNINGIVTNSGTFESLPEGNYHIIITDADIKESKAGNPTINMKLRVMDGNFKNRIVWDTLTFSEKAMFRVKNVLDCVNSPLVTADNVEIEDIAKDLVGREAIVFLEPSVTLKGDPSNKVKGFRPVKDDLAALDKTAASAGRPAVAPAPKPAPNAASLLV